MKLMRRMNDIPDGLLGSRGGDRCPDIWETDGGDFVIIGGDVTDDVKANLPAVADVSGSERAVLIPRKVLLSARKRLPEE